MNVQVEGIVLLDYKILGRETQKPQSNLKKILQKRLGYTQKL